ncbi:hypothetical protein TL16_g03011 [Triparma laevis f. inornata]|uniref:Uncharacterized protein n=2 Tax=Triparma laevis TaxID=1534972 RepID=A0A9W7FSK8_9STRA|nr:hypothetical protein TL16_g03011 [Triparma laevis f. inornata]GMI17577.1 hypothetical protein TrLO_g3921 [Triparma laevis f. longispina]
MAQVGTEGMAEVELMKDEKGGLMMEAGITTITFYSSSGGSTFEAANAAIRAQLDKVVGANPWLAGRLVKGKTGTALSYPKSPTAAQTDQLFQVIGSDDALKLSPSSSYSKICTDMYASNKVVVGSGFATKGKDKPLAILTLLQSTDSSTFAFVFSISHVIADGRTYYDIFNMLSPGTSVRELNSARAMTFSETMRDACGRKELAWMDSLPAICMMIPVMACPKKPVCCAFEIDPARVEEMKASAARDGGVPYVTTNDILTSGFFNECNSRIGMMGIDCRGKIDGVGEDMAGNYVSALSIDPDTFATPASMRKMLSSTPYQTTQKPMPSCSKWCIGMESNSFSMVTNWSSFAGDLVKIEGFDIAYHLPMQNPAYMMFDMMIPFSCGGRKKGVICWTVSTDEDGLKQALPVGASISKELFP